MNIEQRSLSEVFEKAQETRRKSLPLKIANSWGKLIEVSTNTKTKQIGGFTGMMGVVVLSMIIDGNFAIGAAEGLAFLGGATIGEKIPLLSGPVEFVKEKKAIRNVKKKKNVSPEEIAKLLNGFPDIIDLEEVKLWPGKKLSEESLEHPERYLIMKAVLNNSPEAPDAVIEKFMEAQKLAQEKRGSKKYMRREALKKGADIMLGVAAMVGLTSGVSFGLGYQAQAGIVGLADDVVLYATLGYSFAKEKIKVLLSKYK